MANKVDELKLGDVLISLKTGLNPRKNFTLNTADANNWYVTVRELNGTGVDFLPQTDKVNDDALKLINNRSNLEVGDVLFSGTGTIGKTAIITSKPTNWNIKEGVYVLKPNKQKIDPYYLLCQLNYYGKMGVFDKQTGGSTVFSIPMKVLADTKIFLPTLEGQKRIGNIISLINNKIALNNRINSELEEAAKLIYHYWFIQYDFPNTNSKPYKSSGGKMIYSSELKCEIPFNWHALNLADVISKSGTGLNPRSNFKLGQGTNYYVTIKNVDNGKVVLDDRCDRIDDEALRIIQKRSDLQKGDVLFTSIQPVGVTYLIQDRPTNWNINESVFTLRGDYEKVTPEYLFMVLSSQEMKVYTSNASAGSVHKGIRHSVLKDYRLAYPGKELIDKFSDIVKPMLRQAYLNDEENRELLKLRDWLLPMLMTGQITVNKDE
ncbi:restriction endonuclease subunit S [Candidatus Saccharibacteria bacterium]|nr:restriction endonuclease subunit S [Candidatus Saccharibacteria bacterium]